MARIHDGTGPPPADKKMVAFQVASQLHQDFYVACLHSSSISLSDKWLAVSPNKACPLCVITRVTGVIKIVQQNLIKRGGIFMSRGEDRHKPCDHRILVNSWRTAKIHGHKVIHIVEQLVAEENVKQEDKAMLSKALAIWESENERLWKVPGHSYEGEEDEMSEEKKEAVRLMMVLLEETVKKLIIEMDEEDKRAGKCLPLRYGIQESTIEPRNGEAEEAGPVTFGQPMSSTPPRMPEPSSSLAFSRTAPPTRPILKRKLSSFSTSSGASSSLSPQPNKRVRTASYATVSSDHLTTSNPSPFQAPSPQSTQITVQRHRSSTIAELKRPKRAFHRTSDAYVPGQWASPAFSEKANTSFSKVTWDEAAEITRREIEEWEEEKMVAEGLKKVSGAWVVRWWLGNVVAKVDLGRIKDSEGDQKVGG